MANFPFDADIPASDDRKRLEVLKAFRILDTDTEPIFDRLTLFAQSVASSAMAAISLIDEDRQWFKSSVGLNVRQTDRVISFCTYTITQDHPFIVEDASHDPAFRENPLVVGPPHIRFYAGFPLITPGGFRIGSLAVLDTKPRRLSQARLSILKMLADEVMTHIDLRRQRNEMADIIAERESVNRQLLEQAEDLREAQRIGKIGSWEMELPSRNLRISDEAFRIFGGSPTASRVPYQSFMASVHRGDRAELEVALEAALNNVAPLDLAHRIVLPGRAIRHVHERAELRTRQDGRKTFSGTVQDVTDQVEAEKRIWELAYFDPLTGLPNRRFILERMEKMVAMRQRMPYDGAVLFIDLDNFKTLNDTFGHDKGDLLLKSVAQRIKSCVRNYDSVGRFGGDEFVVLVEHVGDGAIDDGAHALHAADKIVAVLNQPFDLAGMQYHATPSIGIALINGEILTTSELLTRADMAMYKAKAEGRNTVRFYSNELQEAVTARAELEADIRMASAHHEFYLDLQPQTNVSEEVTGVEMLLRWDSPQRGKVLPNEFILLAEELGLIMPIGTWVLEEACALIARWSAIPALRDLTVSVNVSVRQFHHPEFARQVTDVLSRTGANPSRLKLEITESMLISDYQDTRNKMMELKALGIRFSLDDFGTGCSSLSHLQRLPIDQLKIDRSFVNDVTTDSNDATITRTIISLAKSMGLGVIAEGVETEEQRQFLVDEGCVDFQGFLYHQPLAANVFESRVMGRNPA